MSGRDACDLVGRERDRKPTREARNAFLTPDPVTIVTIVTIAPPPTLKADLLALMALMARLLQPVG